MPNGWKELPLGKLISQKKERYCADIPDDVEIFSVTNEEGFVRSEEFFKKQVFSKDITGYKIVRKGDFAYNPSRINVGSVALLSDIEIATVSPIYEVFRPNENIIGEYLLYFLKSRVGLNLINHYSEGAVRHSLKYDGLSRIPIPLPPLPLQQKIVEILEEADSLRKLRKQADEKMKDLTPSLFVEMFGDPTTNPKRWGVKKLGEIAEIKSGGTPSRKREEYFKGAIPWVTSVSLSKPYLTADDAKELITQDAIENSATKLIGRKSVLFGNRVCVGNVAINLCNICFSQDVLAILYHEDFLVPEFLWFYLLQKKVYFERITRGSTIKGITVSTLQNTVIPLPPLPLQQEFAERVKEIEAEKQRQAESKKKLDELFNSLMQRAFTGELVA